MQSQRWDMQSYESVWQLRQTNTFKSVKIDNFFVQGRKHYSFNYRRSIDVNVRCVSAAWVLGLSLNTESIRLKPWSNGLASHRKLNLRRDLYLVTKRTRKFPPKYMQVAKHLFQGCISLAYRVDRRHTTCVDWGWVAKRWKTCVDFSVNLISTEVSHHKSTQVHASPHQTESRVDSSFQLKFSTCVSLLASTYCVCKHSLQTQFFLFFGFFYCLL